MFLIIKGFAIQKSFVNKFFFGGGEVFEFYKVVYYFKGVLNGRKEGDVGEDVY